MPYFDIWDPPDIISLMKNENSQIEVVDTFEINNLVQDNFVFVLDYSEELNDVVVSSRIDQTNE